MQFRQTTVRVGIQFGHLFFFCMRFGCSHPDGVIAIKKNQLTHFVVKLRNTFFTKLRIENTIKYQHQKYLISLV